MDTLDSVRELGADVAPPELAGARIALHRAMAGEERRRSRRRLGIAFGAVGGTLGASGIAALAVGAFTVGTVVAPPVVPTASAAEEVVLSAATHLRQSEIPDGKFLKVTETFEQIVGLQTDTDAEPFSYRLQDVTGVMKTRWITATYLTADPETPPVIETSDYQPVEAIGDVQAVEDAWNAYYGSPYGRWDEVIGSPRPFTVYQAPSPVRHLPWGSEFQVTWPVIDGPEDSRIDDWGDFASDPRQFLEDLLAVYPAGTTEEEAIAVVFDSLITGDMATASPEYRAVLLGVISLADGLQVESAQGAVTVVRLDSDRAIRRLVFDSETSELLEASQRMTQTFADGGMADVGSSPLIADDAPTTIRRYTQEIVDGPPAVNSAP